MWTTATSTPTASATGRSRSQKLPATKSMHPPKFLRGAVHLVLHAHLRARAARAGLRLAGRRRHRGARAARLAHGGGALGPRRGAGAPPPSRPRAGRPSGTAGMDELGERYRSGVLSLVSPDGFPFSVRRPDRRRPRRAAGAPRDRTRVGVPVHPGRPAWRCTSTRPTSPGSGTSRCAATWSSATASWVLVPHKLVGGFELPPGSMLSRYRLNFSKMRRYRKIAKRELAKRLTRRPFSRRLRGRCTQRA